MDESLLYDGSDLFYSLDYPRDALGFFRAVGHTIASTPQVVASDVLHCIYTELNFNVFFDATERLSFLNIDSLSQLFTLDD